MKKQISIFFLITTLLFSCDSNKVFEKNIYIDKKGWSHLEKPKFKIGIKDTTSSMNILLNVRHSSNYLFSNLWVQINTTNPDGVVFIDTVECLLAKKNGKWIGDGFGHLWDLQTHVKTQKFKRKGEYFFELEQAMRYGDQAQIKMLPEIIAVGIRIEKAN